MSSKKDEKKESKTTSLSVSSVSNQPGDSSDAENLAAEGVYFILGRIGDGTLDDVIAGLLAKNRDVSWNREVQIFINSVGGDCQEGWALVDLMEIVRFPVKTIAMGTACSMGAIILAAGTKGKRFILPNTEIMTHVHSGGVYGEYHELEAGMKGQDREYGRHLRFWMKRSKYKTAKKVEQHILRSSDSYMTAEEAVTHGIADSVLTKKNG
jgi:ATP-dependent Clp protease protease subunit